MSAYFAMGGYAVFIWPSYVLAVVLLAAVFVLASRRLAAAMRALDGTDGAAGESALGDDVDRTP
jgi:heme exporter protein CcmD